jgi:hypothetical protein
MVSKMNKYFNSAAVAVVASIGLFGQVQDANAESFSCANRENARAARVFTNGVHGSIKLFTKDDAYTQTNKTRTALSVEGKIDFQVATDSARIYCESGKFPILEKQILPATDGLRFKEEYRCDMGLGKNVGSFYTHTRQDLPLFSRSTTFSNLELGVNKELKFQVTEARKDPKLDRSATIKRLERHCGIN